MPNYESRTKYHRTKVIPTGRIEAITNLISYGMNIKPLADHILIEPLKEEQKTKSGILLPETAEKERPEQGKVIAVGVGKKTEDGKIIPLDVREGDIVLFTKYGPNEIKIEEKEYLIAKEEDILAILE